MTDYRADTDLMQNAGSIITGASHMMEQLTSQVSRIGNDVGSQYNGQLQQQVRPILEGIGRDAAGLAGDAKKTGSALVVKAHEIEQAMNDLSGNLSSAINGLPTRLSEIGAWFAGIGAVVAGAGAWIFSGGIPTTVVTGGAGAGQVPVGTAGPNVISATPQPVVTQEEPRINEIKFQSQMEADGSGHANCGPASNTMAINSNGNDTADYNKVLAAERNATPTGPTNFKYNDPKSPNPALKNLFEKDYHLQQVDVNNPTAIADHVDQKHPVVILLDNHLYDKSGTLYRRTYQAVKDGPYVPVPDNVDADYLTKTHIVVVHGVQRDAQGNPIAFIIEDPLASGTVAKNFPVPIADFTAAANSAQAVENSNGWYASAVVPL